MRVVSGPATVATVLVAALAPAASAATSQPVGTACPAHPLTMLPAPRWAPARNVLAPPGAISIRLCRYAGLNARARLGLVSARTLTGASHVTALTRELDRLPSGPLGPVACPSDDGSQILAILSYPTGWTVPITMGLSGCNSVTNGIVRRTASGFGSPPAAGPQLLAELERLTAG